MVLVRVGALNTGANTFVNGTYRLVIPSAWVLPGEQVTITASRVGSKPVSQTVTLQPGTHVTQDLVIDFLRLHLDNMVVSGGASGATDDGEARP